MERKIIAVDVDEVLFPLAPTFLEYHNDKWGTSIRLNQMLSYYIEDITGETAEVMLEKIKAYIETEHYAEGKPIEGAIAAIKKLRQTYKLAVVTSRDHFFRGHTEDFLNDHFKGLFDELHYTHQADSPDVVVPKHQICKDISAVALIDDHPNNVLDCAKNGVPAILFGNYPWNQLDPLPERVVRVDNWQGVVEYFEANPV
jgi:uncharacterized HAD superfamily protein